MYWYGVVKKHLRIDEKEFENGNSRRSAIELGIQTRIHGLFGKGLLAFLKVDAILTYLYFYI